MTQSDTAPRATWKALPRSLRAIAVAGAWFLLVAIPIWLIAALAARLTLVVAPVLVGLLIAAVFQPVVERFSHRRLPDWVVPLLCVLLLAAAVSAAVALAAGRVASEVPRLRDQAQQLRSDVEQQVGIRLPSFPGTGGSSGGGGGSQSTDAAAAAVEIGTEILVGMFLALALAFLFMKDGAQMWGWMVERTGGAGRRVDAAGRAAWGTLSTYVRGITIVAVFDATAVAVGLMVLGVPLVLTLALLQFLGSYVPTFGAFVAGAVAVAVALVAGGIVTAGLTLLLVVVVQQIGNSVIEPWVMGRTLPLHAAVVLVAVTAGAVLWGVAGAFLFVPLAAAASAAAHELRVGKHVGTDDGATAGSVQGSSGARAG